MNDRAYQLHAQRLLDIRQEGRLSYGRFLRTNYRSYLILVGIFGPILVALLWLKLWPAFLLLAGYVLGIVMRDLGWVRSVMRAWPISLEFTDWPKVERVASLGRLDAPAP